MKKRVLIVAISSLVFGGIAWGGQPQSGNGNGNRGGQIPPPQPRPEPSPQPQPRQPAPPKQGSGTPRSTGTPRNTGTPTQTPSVPYRPTSNNGPSNDTNQNNNNSQNNTNDQNSQMPRNTFFWPYGSEGYPWRQSSSGVYSNDEPTSNTPSTSTPAPTAPSDGSGAPMVSAPGSTDTTPFPSASKAGPTTVPAEPAVLPAKSDPAVIQASAELDAAMGRLKASLMKRPDYKAAVADKQSAQAQAAALRDSGDGTPDQIMAAAHRGLEDGQTIASIEREAIAGDPAVIAAKAHLAAAIAAHNAAQGVGSTALPAGTPLK